MDEKSDELLGLEEEIIDLLGEENPTEEEIIDVLDDVYILGYLEAVQDMMGDDSSPDG